MSARRRHKVTAERKVKEPTVHERIRWLIGHVVEEREKLFGIAEGLRQTENAALSVFPSGHSSPGTFDEARRKEYLRRTLHEAVAHSGHSLGWIAGRLEDLAGRTARKAGA